MLELLGPGPRLAGGSFMWFLRFYRFYVGGPGPFNSWAKDAVKKSKLIIQEYLTLVLTYT